MKMNESYQKAWDEFMKSDEFANAMLSGSYAPPEYLETVLHAVLTSCANSHSHRRSNST